ncbi:MAG: 16S rRNA (cytosine(1402)-N(4))-methyltransferase RsmH [bacterium]|nr:16S rRNA (cytosine(1402)-N(4))-methyltransferase RsmH [bacterium]
MESKTASHSKEASHIPVLLEETIDALNVQPGDNAIDGTIGGGGHSAEILKHSSPSGQLIGLDSDTTAIRHATERLQPFAGRVHIIQANYSKLKQIRDEQFPNLPIRSVLLDLGLSSLELEDRDRGFSFLNDTAPLDMRFSKEGRTAADILNTAPKNFLKNILSEYGQENYTRQIADEILRVRQKQKFSTVGDLVAAVLRVYRETLHSKSDIPWIGGRHPATKTFQALRMAVNDELSHLENGLEQAIDVLESGGRLAIISFHSGEDRIVKEFFRKESRDCLCPPEVPVCRCGHHARLKIITRKVVQPGRNEIKHNPRARSAKLRVAEKK